MPRRAQRSFLMSIVATAVVVVLSGVACASNPYGQCVSVYQSGQVVTYETDKKNCEADCLARIYQNPGLIKSCYFSGTSQDVVGP
jgi:hypothetical protein